MESRIMKISRVGILASVVILTMLTGSCSFYYRIMSRKALVDGAKAYNDRKFDEAENEFRKAAGYDESLSTFESRTAQLFLARTIHSGYAGNRGETKLAESAIAEYKKVLPAFMADVAEKQAAVKANPGNEMAVKELKASEDTVGSIVRAVAGLYENLQQQDKWKAWQTEQAKNEKLPARVRAASYISMGAKDYNCANEISDNEPVKKTVTVDGEPAYQFSKPEKTEDFDKLKECVAKGQEYIDAALKLDPESDSGWSYKTSLLIQESRIAEMNGDSEGKEKFKTESENAKKKFEELAAKRKKAEEAEARKALEERAKKEGKKVEELEKELNPE